MCGFVGFTNHIDNSNRVLQEMLDKIKHRGPDAEGTYIDEDIALGHRRLSIIDVSEAGTQPLYSEDAIWCWCSTARSTTIRKSVHASWKRATISPHRPTPKF